MNTPRVLIMRCGRYDPDLIGGLVREGMQELGVRPSGKILLKPNAVLAHPRYFPHAYTRKEFLEGVVLATKARAQRVEQIAVGERSGITVPTRYSFRNAGYFQVIRRHGLKAFFFEETRQVPLPLRSPGRLRDRVFVPEPVAACDGLINLPKFKAHPWCRLTLSLKNYIGLQDDAHRLLDHNIHLEEKIVDLQEVVPSRFIAVDAVIAGQKMMLTPTPFPLGAIVMGTNACAVDTVACHMVHVDPRDVIHLRLASERGYGPMDLGEIEVAGDFPLDEVQEKTRRFEFCVERIDRYFQPGGFLHCTVGRFPEGRDYCWGGCPGALQEAAHILRVYDEAAVRAMRPVRYVVGETREPLELQEGERVLFAGECTAWRGRIRGKEVCIEGRYRPPQPGEEAHRPSNDMLRRTAAALWNTLKRPGAGHLHARGCPVSVADHVHYLARYGGIRNPNLDPRLLVPVTLAYCQMRLGRFWNRFIGRSPGRGAGEKRGETCSGARNPWR